MGHYFLDIQYVNMKPYLYFIPSIFKYLMWIRLKMIKLHILAVSEVGGGHFEIMLC